MKKINMTVLVLMFVFAAGLMAPSAMATTKQGHKKHHKKNAQQTDKNKDVKKS